MSRALQVCVVAWCVSGALGLLCYNCSTTHTTSTACAGEFIAPYKPFNSTVKFLVKCTADNAMCFVRSWRARAKHAWIVQRGCYQSMATNDPLPKLMNKPTRAMTCTHRKLSDAEYKVCLCRADWCNLAPVLLRSHYFVAFILIVIFVMHF